MPIYEIAGLRVHMNPQGKILAKQGASYLKGDEDTKADIEISEQMLYPKNNDVLRHEWEYIHYGAVFYKELIKFRGMLIHASAIAYKDGAYLFSAPCGTGKSTHTALWQKVFGESEVTVINDDKPAIRCLDDDVCVYGTPFSGKTDKNTNIKVRLRAICIIERDEENSIKVISSDEAIPEILNQTIRPNEEDLIDMMLDTLDKILENCVIFRLKCNMRDEAAIVAHDYIRTCIQK